MLAGRLGGTGVWWGADKGDGYRYAYNADGSNAQSPVVTEQYPNSKTTCTGRNYQTPGYAAQQIAKQTTGNVLNERLCTGLNVDWEYLKYDTDFDHGVDTLVNNAALIKACLGTGDYTGYTGSLTIQNQETQCSDGKCMGMKYPTKVPS